MSVILKLALFPLIPYWIQYREPIQRKLFRVAPFLNYLPDPSVRDVFIYTVLPSTWSDTGPQ